MATETSTLRAMAGATPDDVAAIHFLLYDSEGEDRVIAPEDVSVGTLGDQEMLWGDVDLECVGDLEGLWRDLGVDGFIDELSDEVDVPKLIHRGDVLQLRVTAVRWDDSTTRPMVLHCLVGENWVVTLHEGGLDLVDQFNKPFHGETRFGELGGPAFLAVVLDWQLSGYFKVIEEVQADIDELDEELLADFPDEDTMLRRLQTMRRNVRELRNLLTPHRNVIEMLSHPEADAALGAEVAGSYRPLKERLNQALDAVDTTREMIVGSFDIFMTRTAQATNDVMRRLTIVSVLLLPAVVIAGIMGMNFKVGLFELSWMFWVTLGIMAALAAATLWVAKRNKWL